MKKILKKIIISIIVYSENEKSGGYNEKNKF